MINTYYILPRQQTVKATSCVSNVKLVSLRYTCFIYTRIIKKHVILKDQTLPSMTHVVLSLQPLSAHVIIGAPLMLYPALHEILALDPFSVPDVNTALPLVGEGSPQSEKISPYQHVFIKSTCWTLGKGEQLQVAC